MFQFTLPTSSHVPSHTTNLQSCSISLYQSPVMFQFTLPISSHVPVHSTNLQSCSSSLYQSRMLCLLILCSIRFKSHRSLFHLPAVVSTLLHFAVAVSYLVPFDRAASNSAPLGGVVLSLSAVITTLHSDHLRREQQTASRPLTKLRVTKTTPIHVGTIELDLIVYVA